MHTVFEGSYIRLLNIAFLICESGPHTFLGGLLRMAWSAYAESWLWTRSKVNHRPSFPGLLVSGFQPHSLTDLVLAILDHSLTWRLPAILEVIFAS